MKNVRLIISGLATLAAIAMAGGNTSALDAHEAPMLLAQSADCYSIGQRVAAEMGGQLAAANAENQGGQTVCRIVVLIPGSNGERPRRAEVVVPAR
jgi:hypothetical protein